MVGQPAEMSEIELYWLITPFVGFAFIVIFALLVMRFIIKS